LKRILIIGGGFQSLIIVKLLNEYGTCPTIIDSAILNGTISSYHVNSFIIDKVPFFLLSSTDVKKLEELLGQFDIVEKYIKPIVIKPGPLMDKIWAMKVNGSMEKPWPLKWTNALYYPKNGWYSILARLKHSLKYGHIPLRLKKINVKEKVIRLTHRKSLRYDILISTIPLNEFLDLINMNFINLSPNLRRLRYCHMVSLIHVIKGKSPDWIIGYYGGTGMLPHTLIIMSNISRAIVPQGYFTLHSLVSYSREKGLRAGFVEQVKSQLKRRGIISSLKDVIVERVFNIRYACINPRDVNDRLLRRIIDILARYNIMLYGRLACWREYNIAEVVENAKDVVDEISEII